MIISVKKDFVNFAFEVYVEYNVMYVFEQFHSELKLRLLYLLRLISTTEKRPNNKNSVKKTEKDII